MTERNIYYNAEKAILNEIAKDNKLFSFRTIVRVLTASSIAKKL